MRKTVILTFLSFFSGVLVADTSTNVPLDHWAYQGVDILIGQGLVKTAMMATRPVTRVAMARLIVEAVEHRNEGKATHAVVDAWLTRLENEFRYELDRYHGTRSAYSNGFVKPVEDPYLRLVWTEKAMTWENDQGRSFASGTNARVGMTTRGVLWNRVAWSVRPEWGVSSGQNDIDVMEGYAKFGLGNWEVQVGKDSVSWGPGYHGSLVMSPNAEPLNMLKVSNANSVLLPWVFKYLGPFRLVYFVSELEGDRVVPDPQFTGMRVTCKPHPIVELGISRTSMFGGQGQPEPTFWNYFEVFTLAKENPNTNQLGGFDVSVLVPTGKHLPFRSVKLYADLAGEDEAGWLPTKWAMLYGVKLNDILKTGKTDLIVEYGQTSVNGFPYVFYNHSVYQSGYRYKSRVMGHHMDSESKDLFVRLGHYLKPDLRMGFSFERLADNVVTGSRPLTYRYGADFLWFAPKNFELKARYRYERLERIETSNNDNHIFEMVVAYDF
ncbi:capsule assembly Wzi family protein [Planctomycetota bacterium]